MTSVLSWPDVVEENRCIFKYNSKPTEVQTVFKQIFLQGGSEESNYNFSYKMRILQIVESNTLVTTDRKTINEC